MAILEPAPMPNQSSSTGAKAMPWRGIKRRHPRIDVIAHHLIERHQKTERHAGDQSPSRSHRKNHELANT